MACVSGYSGKYLIVKHNNGCTYWDMFRYLVWADPASASKFLGGSEDGFEGGRRRWVVLVSVVIGKILSLVRKPLKGIGYLLEFVLNLFLLNGNNLCCLIHNIFHGRLVIPMRGSEKFLSIVGLIDVRTDLVYRDAIVSGNDSARAIMDLSVMSSKLAYENPNVVKHVVLHKWKMHFVDFLNCWNDRQKALTTQVFIICDKPEDANLILISFRGTNVFNADDYLTDFDFSWYEIPNVGKVHVGFLEAMGLGSRADVATFGTHLAPTTSSGPPHTAAETAYYAVSQKLKSLLDEHKNARFVVTGHSLGGALAILFPTVLAVRGEDEVMERLSGVYTFGQPRIGDKQLGRFMKAHVEVPVRRYFRVVYSYDVVPRLPPDETTFSYKHFGVCLYYNSFHSQRVIIEEPDPNLFSIRYLVLKYAASVWELARGFVIGYDNGSEYKEGWLLFFVRLIGLSVAIPGLPDHFPTNYINSTRIPNLDC